MISNQHYNTILSFSACFSCYWFKFLFKSEFFAKFFAILDLSTNSFITYLCIKYTSRKFIRISSSGISLIFDILASKTVFLTKALTLRVLFSTSLIFVSKTVVVNKPVRSGTLFVTSRTYFLQIFVICIVMNCLNQSRQSGILFPKLFTFVFSVLNFLL